MTKNWLVLLFVILFVSCRSGKETNRITVVSYNVENLFDTEDDPHKNDNEFLPRNNFV